MRLRALMSRSRLSTTVLVAVGALALFGVPFVGSAVAQVNEPSDNLVTPVIVVGNPSCTSLGYDFGYKPQPEPPPSGTYTFPGTTQTVTINSDGTYFDWASTLGIDAVIVKGGNEANSYLYDPPAESFGDGGLHSPPNASGAYAAISHIEFCYDYELTATKTANAQYTRTYTWTITKAANPTSHSGFAGATFGSDYDIVVDQTTADSDFAVAGAITVNNPTPFTVTFSVSDSVGGTAATVSCPTSTLAPGASTVCTYSAALDSKTGGTNTATITSSTSGVGGATASASYTFGDPTTTVGDPTVNVTDTFPYPGGAAEALGSASGDSMFDNDQTFACSPNPADYTNGQYSYVKNNRATIVENGQYADASVTVTCYAPVVTKTASATYDETHTWSIEKSVTPTEQTGYPGEKLPWTWKVVVSETSEDTNFAVSGKIFVKNPNPDQPMTVVVTDVLDDGTQATVDCNPITDGAQNSLTVAAGATGECSYTAAPSGKGAELNTATATFNGVGYTGSAVVSFVKNVIGGTATVTDDQIGLGESLTAGAGPWEFTDTDSHTCSTSADDYGADGTYSATEENTATVTASNGQTDSDDAETTYTCEAGFVDLLKTTNGVVDATMSWSFKLYGGPDGFGTAELGSGSTFGDADGVLEFGDPALSPDETYTVCELGIPAGYTSFWQVDVDGDGTFVTVVPYNPDANNVPSEDLGNRCVDFGADTNLPVTVGKTIHFKVDNTQPGGDPRTPGYWKNWNRCTPGGQAANADRNGGYAEGFWLLEDVLNPTIGGGITWDDILNDTFLVVIDSCEEAVEILDQRVVNVNGNVGDGKKLASDGARTLAMHLLAAQLNFGAGACTTQTVLDKALEAETLLDKINFDGTKTTAYLTSKSADYAYALQLAKYLDQYNNGMYCGSLMP
jgi:hypothetical protein